jgi:glycosyltransferase involved in cell wall biosynthesis
VAGAARDLRFDLVTATVDRTAPLEALLASLENQTHTAFRLVVVDQNADDRVQALLHAHPRLDVLHLRSQRGLSRARNAALPRLDADLVAFPDDDCLYGPDLLARVAARFATDGGLDGLTGRAVDADGKADPSWREDSAALDPSNLWNRVISFTIFLRRSVVAGVGLFDERLGLGSGTPWSSGEELDYVLRAVRSGARVVYDPAVTVTHARRRYTSSELRAVGLRDGASVGWLLRRHGYGGRTTARMLLRPVGGIGASLARGDLARASFHAATLRGRVRGYIGARSS